ncbi:MAG: ribbon-helix-helix protein, CopG family [Arachnia sp.]
MSVMERRLQLLLDQERFARVDSEAKRSGRSVSAVIRGAIDLAYPSEAAVRVAALTSLVDLCKTPRERPEEDWAAIKDAYEDDVAGAGR